MAAKLIPHYLLNGFTNDGKTVLATREDSMFSARRDATYTRKVPSLGPNGVYSIPSLSFTARRDAIDEEGKQNGQRLSVLVDVRIPTISQDADIDALIDDLRAYVNDVDLKNNLVRQLLPTCCADETSE